MDEALLNDVGSTDSSLNDLVRVLRARSQMSILVAKAVPDAVMASRAQPSLPAGAITMREALEQALGPWGLSYVVEDGALVITTVSQ